MAHGDVETYFGDGKWHIGFEGYRGVIGTFDTREEAVASGKTAAEVRGVAHIIREAGGGPGSRFDAGSVRIVAPLADGQA